MLTAQLPGVRVAGHPDSPVLHVYLKPTGSVLETEHRLQAAVDKVIIHICMHQA